MLVLITVENGVKKVIPLTADAGAGNPVGSLLHTYKKSNPSGYLYCDGSTFDQTKYPALYQYLGSNVLPDYRECVAVGAEQNTTDTIATHDVYTEGQFKDDQLQDHKHYYADITTTNPDASGQTNALVKSSSGTVQGVDSFVNPNTARVGTTTHGKQKAVYIYIKATSGLTENQQENVLNTINENLSYSTEEHKTGKKWIDGKDIYSKTYYSATNWANETSIGTISNLAQVTNIQDITSINGTAVYQNFGSDGTNVSMARVSKDSNNLGTVVVQRAGGFVNSYPSTVTLEYTKTTDN